MIGFMLYLIHIRGEKMLLFYAVLETVEDQNEKQILEALFIGYEKKIFRYIRSKYNFSYEDTEDMTAQTFLLMVKYKHKFMGVTEERQLSLLINFARCSCINLLKKKSLDQQHLCSISGEDGDNTANITDLSDPVDFTECFIQKDYDQQCMRKVREIIACMPSPSREILVMKTDAGMNSSEIGAILHMPPATVRTIANRAYKRIRKELFHDKSKAQSIL